MAFDAFALILTMLGLGMAFSRLRALPDNTADVLNRIVLYVCLPAAVLMYVPRLHLDISLIGLVATPWLLMLCTLALVSLATRIFGFARDAHAVLLICVALANSSFIGYPMVRALLGDHALPYAVVYDQFGTFVLLSTFGLYVIARYSGDTPPTAAQILLRIARFPPLWALLFALTLMPEQPPTWIGTGLKQLADAMLPLVMLAVGFSLQLRLPLDELKPLGIGLLLKLVVMPALALPIAWAFGLQGTMLQTNVLESAMPTMITAAALAIAHRLAPRLAAALVGYGILLSLATLPAWVWVLQRGAVLHGQP
ncbi:AEC family transporter [Stenotrophomonas rhizophila]|uniref:AEC family transporter n=1 Tax=Stenotrophomonas TaxID=40323 RepID=UPI003B80C816